MLSLHNTNHKTRITAMKMNVTIKIYSIKRAREDWVGESAHFLIGNEVHKLVLALALAGRRLPIAID